MTRNPDHDRRYFQEFPNVGAVSPCAQYALHWLERAVKAEAELERLKNEKAPKPERDLET